MKADKYWSDELKERVPLGDISITLVSIDRSVHNATVREFQLTKVECAITDLVLLSLIAGQ